jgi:hippurate hydrolase
VLLRTEMDALPVEERTGLPYASRQTGHLSNGADGDTVPIAHACGHDAHLTCLIGAASLLQEARDSMSCQCPPA